MYKHSSVRTYRTEQHTVIESADKKRKENVGLVSPEESIMCRLTLYYIYK